MPVLIRAVSVADGVHSVDSLYVNTTEQLLLAIPTHGAAAACELHVVQQLQWVHGQASINCVVHF